MNQIATPTSVNQKTGEILEHQNEPSEFERLLKQNPFSVRDLLQDDTLDKVMRLAEVMASSRITCPKHLQGNVGDCAAVIGQAMRWQMDHNAVAQKTHLVNGTLGYEAQLIIAVLNGSAALATRLDFEWYGDWTNVDGKSDKSSTRGVRVFAVIRGEHEPRVLDVSMAQVGSVRNSPNWGADPRQQIAYLAAKRWGRLHAPDVILGVYTPDELEDGADYGVGSTRQARNAPPAAVAAAAMPTVTEITDEHKRIGAEIERVAAEEGVKAFKKAWTALKEEQRVALGGIEERDRLLAVAQRTDEEMTRLAAKDAEAQAGDANV